MTPFVTIQTFLDSASICIFRATEAIGIRH